MLRSLWLRQSRSGNNSCCFPLPDWSRCPQHIFIPTHLPPFALFMRFDAFLLLNWAAKVTFFLFVFLYFQLKKRAVVYPAKVVWKADWVHMLIYSGRAVWHDRFSFISFYLFAIAIPNLGMDVFAPPPNPPSPTLPSLLYLLNLLCRSFVVSAFWLHKPASWRHPGAGVILLKISFMCLKDCNKH